MLPTTIITYIMANGGTPVAGHRCMWECTSCGARPTFPWFESRTFTCRLKIVIDLMRCLTIQRRVRSVLNEPVGITHRLPAKRFSAKWHKGDPRAFVLEAQNGPLYQGNAAVLTNGAEAWRDALAITPVLEDIAPELLAFVADNIFRRRADVDDSFVEEGWHLPAEIGALPGLSERPLTGRERTRGVGLLEGSSRRIWPFLY